MIGEIDSKHRTISEYLLKLKSGRLLDAGGGEGGMYELMRNQFDVTVCDIKISSVKGVRADRVDLNNGLPYKTGTYDYVTSVEVIEHIENPHMLIREFSRVLKKGGMLIISTPNITNMFSRLKFLISGKFFCFGDVERNLRHGHINPMTFFEIKDSMERSGMKIEEILTNEHLRLCGVESARNTVKRMISNLAYVIMYPILRPKSKNLLKGDILIIVARKG